MTESATPSDCLLARDPLALAMFAAWCNLPADKLPAEMRAHTCPATAEAWGRVAAAVRSFMGLDEADALRVIHSAVSEYLPPDGIEAKACISKILAVLDRPAIANTLGKHADGRA